MLLPACRHLAAVLSLVMLITVSMLTVADVSPLHADDVVLQKSSQQAWFKGNMHTHSLWSDGDDYPEMIADWYQQHGYNFLVFTDHNVLHTDERWIDVEKNKGGLVAFNKLVEQFGKDNVPVREQPKPKQPAAEQQDVKQQVETTDQEAEAEHEADTERQEKFTLQTKLQTFDQTFEQFAKPGEYILIQGEEISDRFQNKPIHMCATNTSDLLPPMHGDSVYEVMQNNINVAISMRERSGVKTLVHLNHPNFGYGVTAEQLMKVQGENFFEVFNGHPSVNDAGDATHASTERMWDIINTFRLADLGLPLMYGLATDDGHNYHKEEAGQGAQPGRGWVMVLAKQLDPNTLVESLEAGRFYSSSGVTLRKITTTKLSLTVEIEPVAHSTYQIQFIGTKRGFDQTSTQMPPRPAPPVGSEESKNPEVAVESISPRATEQLTRKYSQDIGATLKSVDGTSATYEFTGDELYVRAIVTSSLQHSNPSVRGQVQKAWVQPVVPVTSANR